MKINKLEISKKAVALATAGVLGAVMLTGCNKQIVDIKYEFNKAIIFRDGTATIIEIEKWNDYDGEQYQIITSDGLVIITSSYDTKLINDLNSDITAEDVARSIGGEDVEITYLTHEDNNARVR